MSSTAPNTGRPETPTGQKLRLQTFRALHYRNFRLLWISLVVSSVGTWMQIVAQSLLILQITRGSALALGIVALAQSSSFFLFALIGGSVADRVDKRRFLLITQSLSMGLAFLLGILTTPFRNVTLYDKRNLIRQEFGNCPETVASILESGGL